MISYLTYNDFTNDIRNNFKKIPKDVIGVIGIPRSGMLPATIIAEYLNVGLATIDEFINNKDNPLSLFSSHGFQALSLASFQFSLKDSL